MEPRNLIDLLNQKQRFNDDFINYIYECSPIDYWPSSWRELFKEQKTPFDTVRIKPISSKLFSIITEFLFKLSHLSWMGNIRDYTEIYYTDDDLLGFRIGLKQDANGTTFIGSKEQLTEEDLSFLVDNPSDVKYVTLIYSNPKPHAYGTVENPFDSIPNNDPDSTF